jgi:hypothetical protein
MFVLSGLNEAFPGNVKLSSIVAQTRMLWMWEKSTAIIRHRVQFRYTNQFVSPACLRNQIKIRKISSLIFILSIFLSIIHNSFNVFVFSSGFFWGKMFV